MLEELQSKKIKEYQINIAQAVGLRKEIIAFLEKVPEWKTREVYYLCVMDGMLLSEMKEYSEQQISLEELKKKRVDFLRKKYTDLDSLGNDVSNLKEEVTGALSENRSIKEFLEKNLDAALEKQAAAQEETIRTKNEQIEWLKERVRELEEKLTSSVNLIPGETTKENEKRKKKGVLELLGIQKLWKAYQVRKFLREYINNKNMSLEQQAFLLGCLEEGMSLSDIEKFASPNLDVSVMERIKKLQENNYTGGNSQWKLEK